MLEEVEVPPAQPMLVCPCCKFSFTKLEKFVEHCESMKKTIDDAVAKARLPRKKNG